MENFPSYKLPIDLSFGTLIRSERTKKGWTVAEFIEKLERDTLSPAYICKIETKGEIPSPEVICDMAWVLKLDIRELLIKALIIKTAQYHNELNQEYGIAAMAFEKATEVIETIKQQMPELLDDSI
jgi:transcriptional regulator with XRE-family HTH domain